MQFLVLYEKFTCAAFVCIVCDWSEKAACSWLLFLDQSETTDNAVVYANTAHMDFPLPIFMFWCQNLSCCNLEIFYSQNAWYCYFKTGLL